MKEVKLIQRYAKFADIGNAAAGVYADQALYNNVLINFNMVVNYVDSGHTSHDLTTSQGIESVSRFDSGIVAANTPHPGIDDPGASYSFPQVSSSGNTASSKCYCPLSAGTILYFQHWVYFLTVTANTIRAYHFWTIGYLCPEDYLSVDAFTAIPG